MAQKLMYAIGMENMTALESDAGFFAKFARVADSAELTAIVKYATFVAFRVKARQADLLAFSSCAAMATILLDVTLLY